MRILLVSEYYKPHTGGVEKVFVNLAERLANFGHQCNLITSRLPNTPKYEEINGVKIHRINVPYRGDRYWFSLLAIPKVMKMAGQADIIHTTTYNAVLPAWLAAKLTGTKSVITIHEILGDMWLKLPGMNIFTARIHRFIEKVLLKLPFDAAVCVSNYTCNRARGLGLKVNKLKTIYNGVDSNFLTRENNKKTRKELGLPDGCFIYMYYGRPGISKGVEYLIQAVPLISDMISDSKLVLILSHTPQNRYKKISEMIKSLNIEKLIIFLHTVSDNTLISYISASNCIVIPSLSEGFGFAAAEACNMGKPVVVSNVASLPEVVSGEYIMVKPKDPEAIASGISRIHKGDTQKSRKKVFDWDRCVSQYIDVYKAITAGILNK
ncbi:MAG: glycosyltransferase family 4 protein [Dehalococcoidales bacterium]|nr:glycosyltransferase family 4 protein [Dehalococcoidales bacterium]